VALGKDIAKTVISSIFKAAPLAKLVLGFMFEKLYTSLAGVDFILDIIVADRRNEQVRKRHFLM
jgi:hypothetical protein